jgi:hypothetical protein
VLSMLLFGTKARVRVIVLSQAIRISQIGVELCCDPNDLQEVCTGE